MNFTDEQVEKLRSLLNTERMKHTLGVERAAIKIAEHCLPDRVDEIRAAALLHDIAKGYPAELSLEIMKKLDYVTDDDLLSPPVYHALIGPTLIERHLPEFSTPDIISAVVNHTTGAPDMSVFDEIIFVADYIEDGRTYESCIAARDFLYNALKRSKDSEEAVSYLHRTVVMILDLTISHIIKSGKHLNLRTVATRNAFLGRLPVPLEA